MELYAVVQRIKNNEITVDFEPSIICDSLEAARTFIQDNIKEIKKLNYDDEQLSRVSYYIFKYILNDKEYYFIEKHIINKLNT